MLDDLTISNGLGWSPDGATMYLADSGPRLVHAFTFDQLTGNISDGRVLVTVAEHVGTPDGLTVDVDGDIWVAIYGGGRVHRYSPEGVLREELLLPAAQSYLLRLRRPRPQSPLRHHRDRGLERRAAARRARCRPRVPVRHRCHWSASSAVPTQADLVVG